MFLFVIFPWLLPFPRVLWHDPQPRQHLWVEPEVLPASLLDGVNVTLYCQSDSRHIHFGVRQFHPVMSGITFSVQYQHFELCQLPSNKVEKETRRNWKRNYWDGKNLGPVLEVQIVKILGPPGLEISIPLTLKHLKNEIRSSTEPLSAFQKSEGREPSVEEEESNSIKETCAHPVTSHYGNNEA